MALNIAVLRIIEHADGFRVSEVNHSDFRRLLGHAEKLRKGGDDLLHDLGGSGIRELRLFLGEQFFDFNLRGRYGHKDAGREVVGLPFHPLKRRTLLLRRIALLDLADDGFGICVVQLFKLKKAAMQAQWTHS
jgi:hypothetical protein